MLFVTKKKYNDLKNQYYYQKQIIKAQELENYDLLEQLIALEQENAKLKKEKKAKTTDKSTKTKNVSQKTVKEKDETKPRKTRTKKEDK